MVDYRKAATERLIDALNIKNPTQPLLLTEVVFGPALPSTRPGSNATVVITANHTRLTGQRTVFYNRLDLTTLLTALAVPALIIPVSAATTHDLLPAILEQWQIRLLPTEIIDEPIGTTDIIVRATPTAIGWTGQYTVTNTPDVIQFVMGLDDGTGFELDDGFILLDDSDITE